MKTIRSFFLVSVFAILFTGCAVGKYEQEAGLRVYWDAVNPTNAVGVEYKFDSKSGKVTSILLSATNATEVTLMDTSLLSAKSAVSKSEVAKIAGTREGMLDNNAGVTGEGIATKQELDGVVRSVSSVIKELADLKNSIPGLNAPSPDTPPDE
jgi:hypothetical protein